MPSSCTYSTWHNTPRCSACVHVCVCVCVCVHQVWSPARHAIPVCGAGTVDTCERGHRGGVGDLRQGTARRGPGLLSEVRRCLSCHCRAVCGVGVVWVWVWCGCGCVCVSVWLRLTTLWRAAGRGAKYPRMYKAAKLVAATQQAARRSRVAAERKVQEQERRKEGAMKKAAVDAEKEAATATSKRRASSVRSSRRRSSARRSSGVGHRRSVSPTRGQVAALGHIAE